MKSILDNRPELARQVANVAEIGGYLWQKDGLNVMVEISPSMLQNL